MGDKKLRMGIQHTINWNDVRPIAVQRQKFHLRFPGDQNQIRFAAGKYFIVEHSIKVVAKEDKRRKLKAFERIKAEIFVILLTKLKFLYVLIKIEFISIEFISTGVICFANTYSDVKKIFSFSFSFDGRRKVLASLQI